MAFIKTYIPNLLVYEPTVFEDSRGYFFEGYNEQTFLKEGVTFKFAQDNQAKSSYGVLRGLHYQLNPYAQTKLVRVLSGTILDGEYISELDTFYAFDILQLSDENITHKNHVTE